MPKYSETKIGGYFVKSDSAPDNATGRTIKGRVLEDLIHYIFQKIPGIPIIERNQQNAFLTEEIDLAFWNDKILNGLHFLPNLILVECKNWSRPVDTDAVSYFKNKIEERGLDFGILVAANGITGDPVILSRANFIIATALAQGIRIIVITRSDIETLKTTVDLVLLVKKKLCKLIITQSM